MSTPRFILVGIPYRLDDPIDRMRKTNGVPATYNQPTWPERFPVPPHTEKGPGLHPICKGCRYEGRCNDDECADLDDARHPGRAEMRAAIDDADNNRAGW